MPKVKKSTNRRRRGQGAVFYRKDRKAWYLRYHTAGGKLKTQKLEAKNRTQAKAIADEMLGDANAKSKVEVIQNVARARGLVRPQRVQLAEVPKLYTSRSQLAEKTAADYAARWLRFTTWLVVNRPAMKVLGEIDRETARDYATHLSDNSDANATYNAHLASLAAMTKELLGDGEINPWTGIKKRAPETERRLPLSRDQIRSLRAVLRPDDGDLVAAAKRIEIAQRTMPSVYPPGTPKSDKELYIKNWRESMILEWRVVIDLGLFMAMRLGDAACLQWESVNLESMVILFAPAKTRRTKSDKSPVHIRNTIRPELAESLRMALERRRDDSPFVCPWIAQRYAANKSGLVKDANKIMAASGLTNSRSVTGRKRKASTYTFHSLRHTWVTLAAECNVPIFYAQEYVGHGNEEMTKHYMSADDAAKAAFINSMDFGTDIGFVAMTPSAKVTKAAKMLLAKSKRSKFENELLELLQA